MIKYNSDNEKIKITLAIEIGIRVSRKDLSIKVPNRVDTKEAIHWSWEEFVLGLHNSSELIVETNFLTSTDTFEEVDFLVDGMNGKIYFLSNGSSSSCNSDSIYIEK